MKTRVLFISLALGLGLALTLALPWALSTRAAPAQAAPRAGPAVSLGIDTADGPALSRTEGQRQALAAELRVCATCPYTTVQAAVDAASDGDVIKVAADTYTGVSARAGVTQAVYISKSVTVEGGYTTGDWTAPDPTANPTILDAQGQGRVIYVTGDISPTLEGLEITGGDATGLGGGPWSYDGAGGGIYVVSATATVSNCVIHDNVAGRNDWSGGGGIYLFVSPAVLRRNSIYSNTAGMSTTVGLSGEGGGLAMAGSDAFLTGNTIWNNTGSSAGAGLGGGIYMEAGDPLLYNNILAYNAASTASMGRGGGMFIGFFSDNALLINTVLIDNFSGPTTGSWGAALAVEATAAHLLHTTINGNSGANGSAVLVYGGATPAFTNTIVSNHATVGITATSGSVATVDGVLWFSNGANTGGAGTITVTNAYTGTPAFAADGYHLTAGSAAIDRGVSAGILDDVDLDIRGVPDLGADEWLPEITIDPAAGGTLIYVDTQGLTTTIEIPSGAAVETTTLVFAALTTHTHPLSPGLSFAGHAFDLDAYCQGFKVYLPLVLRGYSASAAAQVSWPAALASAPFALDLRVAGCASSPTPCTPVFQKPVTITIHYSDADVLGVDENNLRLYYWTGTYWEDAASTCAPPSSYSRDLTGNVLSVPICHLSRFSMQG